MAIVQVSADKQTNGRTNQKIYAPDLSMQGHKKIKRKKHAFIHRQGQCSSVVVELFLII